jgi:hypothetical protein
MPLVVDNYTIGTAAAGLQATIGNVAAGSLFAGAQSVAMGGAFPIIGNIVAGAIMAATVAIVKAAGLLWKALWDIIAALTAP